MVSNGEKVKPVEKPKGSLAKNNNEQPPTRKMKRVADEFLENSPKKAKRTALNDITNLEIVPEKNNTILKYLVKKEDKNQSKPKEKSNKSSSVPSSKKSTTVRNPVKKSIVQRYMGPKRSIPPPGVEDFDAKNEDDPNEFPEYAMDIFQYYKIREADFKVPDYLPDQPEVTNSVRAILVDWMVDIQQGLEFNHEVLYTSVKMLDIYLSRTQIVKERLQLIGATIMWIAFKVDDRPPSSKIDDYVYIGDNSYSAKDMLSLEPELLNTIGFDVGYPLSYRFLRRYARVCKAEFEILTHARYFCEAALLDYDFNVGMSESKLAAAALVLAFKVNKVQNWKDTLAYYSGYSISDLKTLVRKLLKLVKHLKTNELKAVEQKYSHRTYFEVAKIVLPKTIDFSEEECPSTPKVRCKKE